MVAVQTPQREKACESSESGVPTPATKELLLEVQAALTSKRLVESKSLSGSYFKKPFAALHDTNLGPRIFCTPSISSDEPNLH